MSADVFSELIIDWQRAMDSYLGYSSELVAALFGSDLDEVGKVPLRDTPVRVPVDALWRVLRGKLAHEGDLKTLLHASLGAALAQLERDLGKPDEALSEWAWGDYHPMTIQAIDGYEAWHMDSFPSPGTRNTVSMAKEEGHRLWG